MFWRTNRNFPRALDIYSAPYYEKDFNKWLSDDNELIESERAVRKLLKAEKGDFLLTSDRMITKNVTCRYQIIKRALSLDLNFFLYLIKGTEF